MGEAFFYVGPIEDVFVFEQQNRLLIGLPAFYNTLYSTFKRKGLCLPQRHKGNLTMDSWLVVLYVQEDIEIYLWYL